MTKPFWMLDAGERREFLGLELARWKRSGFWSSDRVKRFRALVRFSAGQLGMPFEAYMSDLVDDADAALAMPDSDLLLDGE